MLNGKHVVEVLFDDHTSFYAIDSIQVEQVINASDDDQRHMIVVDHGEAVRVAGDFEVDLTLDVSGYDEAAWEDHDKEYWTDYLDTIED